MKVQLLGDPHLGRSFIHGVPLSRRFERENMVWADFERHFAKVEAEVHINMGDLFDKAIVSYDVILRAASVYLKAASDFPKTTFVVLKGNHDLMRDFDRSSAFDLFAKLVSPMDNIKIVTKAETWKGLGLFPYDAITPLAEAVTALDLSQVSACYFHADIDSFGGSTHNLLPTKELAAKRVTQAFTGHVHKRDSFHRDGVQVTVVGSMQPYAHGEESDTKLYVTLTLDQLKKAGDLTGKCVRVLLNPGEMLEDEINCLQLTVKRLTTDTDTTPEVTIGDFDMDTLFKRAFDDAAVSDGLFKSVLGRYQEQRLATPA